ncbi:MAG TPA: GNAT family N-acetyltransferase [Nocardioidaceae bacterium]|nr:GNAT family N-acetyltransferase [Nocardioidaceae bacterium]
MSGTSSPVDGVRRADSQEFERAVDVWRAANPDSGLHAHPGNLMAWAAGEDAYLAIHLTSGRIDGMGLAVPEREHDGDGDLVPGVVHVTGVAVHPERHRCGLGGQLLDHLLGRAGERGYDRARLWTREDNAPARSLFASRGLVPTGRRKIMSDGRSYLHLEATLG